MAALVRCDRCGSVKPDSATFFEIYTAERKPVGRFLTRGEFENSFAGEICDVCLDAFNAWMDPMGPC